LAAEFPSVEDFLAMAHPKLGHIMQHFALLALSASVCNYLTNYSRILWVSPRKDIFAA
jgi:hypothetical protein